MRFVRFNFRQWARLTLLLIAGSAGGGLAQAMTNYLFSPSQTTNLVATNMQSDTWATVGYHFQLSRDKWFTGGYGLTNPVGRSLRIQWPAGFEAQAITAGPNPGKARILLTRGDGTRFSIPQFSFRILGNTGGAGAMLEVMPLIQGEDSRPDPFYYQATGFYGQSFSNSTPELSGFDGYKFSLYMDFAIIQMTLVDELPDPPMLAYHLPAAGILQISWPASYADWQLWHCSGLTEGWRPFTNLTAIQTVGGRRELNVPAGSAVQFFRLAH